MSSNLICSKDSFDRFDDDLCKLLISRLPVDEKMHFECVSKQWQRSLFERTRFVCINEELNP
jgi:hypothetical protein